MEVGASKVLQGHIIQALGLPTPKSVVVHSDSDIVSIVESSELAFPLLRKLDVKITAGLVLPEFLCYACDRLFYDVLCPA